MSDFGTRLKHIRKTRKITQKDLAKNIQVAQSTIANYENNTRFPGSEILRQISDYLVISVDYLLGLTELEVKVKIDSTYKIETVYIYLIDILMEGKTEEAKKIIKSFTEAGSTSIEVIEYIFIPILKLIGDRWIKNEISIAQEHSITGLVERLFEYISEKEGHKQTKDLTALFMVPSGEEHIISLKMATEYFRDVGWNIIFIGKSIPIKSLLETIEKSKVDLVVLSAISLDSINSVSYLVEAIKSNLVGESPKFLLGGNIETLLNQESSESFIDYTIKSIYELPESIDKIENDILNRR